MPTIFLQGKLRIEIRPRERGHHTPHVHAIYQGKDVSIDFDGNIIAGAMDRKAQDEACEWVIRNKDMLMQKWKELH